MAKLKNYWDYLTKEGHTYQMGAQIHRVYLLDLLEKKRVESILDVGCGTGPIYGLLYDDHSQRWPGINEYKGVDYSEGMIEVCKKEFPEANWEVEDARKLNEKDCSWDCVLLLHCLDHLDDYEAAIKEAARVSNKYVLIVLWRPIKYDDGAENNLNNKNRYGLNDGQPDWQDTHLQEYAWKKLEDAFAKANLLIIQKEDGSIINEGNRSNTLILLQK